MKKIESFFFQAAKNWAIFSMIMCPVKLTEGCFPRLCGYKSEKDLLFKSRMFYQDVLSGDRKSRSENSLKTILEKWLLCAPEEEKITEAST